MSEGGITAAHKEGYTSIMQPLPTGHNSDMDNGVDDIIADEGPDGQAGGRGRVARALGSFRKELVYLTHLGWPVVLTQCLHYMVGMVAIVFAGHRGKTELDIVALSTSVLSATAVSVANGFSGYCDTVFAQVYGSDERKKLGTVLQKCLLIITLGICPSLAVHVNLRPLLLFMGHDPTVARMSEQYLLIHIPGSIAVFFYIVLSKYVQNQLEAGVWCSALSQSLTYVSLMVFTIIYIFFSGIYKETWQGWSSECFFAWGPYCKLGGYSLFQNCVEFWAFESGVIMCGALGMQMIAAQAISYQYILIFYTFAWGIGLTGGIRVGQHLGANNPTAARFSSRVTLITAVIAGFVLFILVISLRYQMPRLFTDDREVIELVASLLPILAVAEIFDYLAGTMNGILRGCGRQAFGTYVSVPAFTFVLIVGLTLMLKTSLKIKGFWIAILCALAFQSLVGTFFVIRLNWQDEAKKAQGRVRKSAKTRDDSLLNNVAEVGEMKIIPMSPDEKMETDACLTQLTENTNVGTEKLKPRKLTKKLVLLRLLAFGVSIGCLIISLIVRSVVDIPDEVHVYGNSTYLMGNETTIAMETFPTL